MYIKKWKNNMQKLRKNEKDCVQIYSGLDQSRS